MSASFLTCYTTAVASFRGIGDYKNIGKRERWEDVIQLCVQSVHPPVIFTELRVKEGELQET